ncbi:reverse transcriptase family protein [Lysobacter sp. H23M47]|uniref:reverse transcriptase family protein n=1 Tax=Lysobacter sp. H23M47 TaxID=2781024 RepID=UPI00187FDD5B|nr:reverse transcriptase family protein [Lysobacter sp. H23M47]QOW25510.1 RNA-directed DNA polymerase [Lysobacter sp. H23M47]
MNLLLDVAERSAEENYRPVSAHSKLDGTERRVFSPSRDVRLIQRRLVNRFFRKPQVVSWPPFLFGGIPNDALPQRDAPRDYVACAAQHSIARSALKLDVRSFFDNVHSDVVEPIFSGLLRWDEEPAVLATRVCTRLDSLPQGGITSSYLALLCLFREEGNVARTLRRKGLTYTRYVDDITISSTSVLQEFDFAHALVERMLMNHGLFINSSKVNLQKAGSSPLEVHNLRVGCGPPRLPQREVKRIKQVCRQTELDASEGRRSYSYRRRYFRAVGLVNKLARVGNNQHRHLITRLSTIRPLPSQKDYELATNVAHDLRERYVLGHDRYWYRRRFHILMERLNLIGVEDPAWAANLRIYMKAHYAPTSVDA